MRMIVRFKGDSEVLIFYSLRRIIRRHLRIDFSRDFEDRCVAEFIFQLDLILPVILLFRRAGIGDLALIIQFYGNAGRGVMGNKLHFVRVVELGFCRGQFLTNVTCNRR